LALGGCPRRVPGERGQQGEVRAFQLLADSPERETSQRESIRQDVEVETPDFERTPRLVAVGETPFFRLEGAHARLFGDKDGTLPWAVDNFVLLELFGVDGKRVGAVAVGYMDPVLLDHERVDDLGRQSFTFEPGEVDLTSHLPEKDAFKIRATALDVGGVGRVSDLFVVLSYPPHDNSDDELRTH
jgi:hypothetical protein